MHHRAYAFYVTTDLLKRVVLVYVSFRFLWFCVSVLVELRSDSYISFISKPVERFSLWRWARVELRGQIGDRGTTATAPLGHQESRYRHILASNSVRRYSTMLSVISGVFIYVLNNI